jgi:hypothetical protein
MQLQVIAARYKTTTGWFNQSVITTGLALSHAFILEVYPQGL